MSGYDAENRIDRLAGDTTDRYTYDGDGNRVRKIGTLYWGGDGINVLTESNESATPVSDYIYFGGKRVARIDASDGLPKYYIFDHLNSATVIANASGSTLSESMYYPFGGSRWSLDQR